MSKAEVNADESTGEDHNTSEEDVNADESTGEDHNTSKAEENADESTGEDCVFHVGDDSCMLIVKVNKAFLAAESNVFKSMFNGMFLQEDIVEITDVTPDAFSIMLKFLRNEPYCFFSKELAVNVLYVAEKYQLRKLKGMCEKFLLPKTVEDLFWVAPHAYLYSATVIQTAMKNLLSNYTSDVIFNEKFLEASEQLVLDVVQLNSVADVDELEIFKAVMEWANYQLSKDGGIHKTKVYPNVDKILSHIRFNVITSPDQPAMPQFLKLKLVSRIISSHSNRTVEPKSDERKLNVDSQTTSNKLPERKKIHVTAGNERYFQVEFISPAKPINVNLCYRKKVLTESVSIIQRADLISVFIPSKLASSDSQSSHYWEIIEVSVKCSGYNGRGEYYPPETYGSGSVNEIVSYGQEVHIPIKKSGGIDRFNVSSSYHLIYSLTFYFKWYGSYPWYTDRNISASNLLKNLNEAGFVRGYRFRL